MPRMGQEFKKRILDDVVKPLCGPTLMLRHGDKPEIDRATGLRLQYNLHLYMYPAAAAEAYMSQSGDAQPIELEYPENLIVLSYPNYEHIVRTTGIFRRKLLPLDKLITNQNERDYTLDLQFEGSQDMVASVIAVGCPSVKDVLMAVRDKNRIDAEQSPAMLMTATSGGHRENEADDEDVQCTSQSLSLNCPLSMTRMVLPVRTQHCKHAECFDAKSFIKSYENSMTWSCPHCPSDTDNVIASWKDLYVDGFMLSMLEKYADDVRALSFVIEDNAWHPVSDTRDVAFDMLLERRPEDGDIFDGYFDDADDNDDDDT
ncbi:E3 SUMO-protein ligase pli1, partial [Linderina macrospora]